MPHLKLLTHPVWPSGRPIVIEPRQFHSLIQPAPDWWHTWVSHQNISSISIHHTNKYRISVATKYYVFAIGATIGIGQSLLVKINP